ncbi:hypothetical protein OOT33_13870 [Sphingobium sp. DEHP117]|uniref:hypothetical protein n=1 Tax=Sphingobium sp. DEHP117 TaxID=2993436 RepID=UPI0027D6C68B|nr:hypothetical protein [Sphingobium sp. DEHP117]MDQ4421510.1 hypothetical protein [Sphingobium sp. DEHP117]
MSLPQYIRGTALAAAIDAYDNARCAFHASEHQMSDANKNTIAPMILEAIAAWEKATQGSTELRGGLIT